MNNKTALFIGRFQPFHNGHLDALKQIAEKYDYIKIGIGSSQEEGTERNPYSYEIRKEMIESIALEVNAQIEIFSIPDINDDHRWVDYVKDIVKEFHIVYSGNPHVIKLFEKSGIDVIKQNFNLDINATKIREMMSEEKDIDKYIPYETRRFYST